VSFYSSNCSRVLAYTFVSTLTKMDNSGIGQPQTVFLRQLLLNSHQIPIPKSSNCQHKKSAKTQQHDKCANDSNDDVTFIPFQPNQSQKDADVTAAVSRATTRPRKRAYQACSNCRQKRVRCNMDQMAEGQPCSNCEFFEIECKPVPRKRKRNHT
jgi:hypothetical protein